MRSVVRAALVTVAFSAICASGALAQGTQRIAYINSNKILAQAPGRAEAEAQIDKEMGQYRQEAQNMRDSLNDMVAAYTKSEATLSPAARAGKQKEINTKQTQYQQRLADLEKKAQERQAELIGPIMTKINSIIEQIRAEKGYAMVFDAGNQAGVVVAADSSLDITDEVVARLKAAGPAGPVSSTPPRADNTAGPTPKATGATRPKPPTQR
ncbi:MAG TPA: OmpH family outer membrane protein [Gemmatimonadaceae bacterium]|jgi:outer membrane protein